MEEATAKEILQKQMLAMSNLVRLIANGDHMGTGLSALKIVVEAIKRDQDLKQHKNQTEVKSAKETQPRQLFAMKILVLVSMFYYSNCSI